MPRPKSFDPDLVLVKAMGVFWEKGYDAASISDLTQAMGINRFSLYDTFGDKRELYLKALDSYSTQFVAPMLDRVREISSLADLEAYFSMFIDSHNCKEEKPCCMMHKAAVSMAEIDEDARTRVDAARDAFHGVFVQLFENLKAQGEVSSDLDAAAAAWLVMFAKTGLASYTSSPIAEQESKAAVSLFIASFRR